MNCREAQRRLPGYVDGACRSSEHAGVRQHLDSCVICREELESFRRLAICLAQVAPAAPPPDLATRIRVRASREISLWTAFRRSWSRATLAFRNILEPLAVPATGGILTAVVVFVLVVHNIALGVPFGAVPNDLPLNLVQPARLESLAPFPVPSGLSPDGQSNSNGLMLEATLNSEGRVVSYKILSGPDNSAVQHQLDQLMIFSRFSPLVSFGMPMNGGHVVLNFSEVRVRG
ncbi:MAG: zf-HC2 domain-containing protein [Candidatus Acidiferrales bacterium]